MPPAAPVAFAAAPFVAGTGAAAGATALAAGTATIGTAAAAGGASLFTAANIFTAVTALGTVVSTLGQIRAGQAAEQSANYQAAVQTQQAQREKENAKVRAEDYRRAASAAQGTSRAMLGASGISPSTGSPLLVASDFAVEKELNIRRLQNQGKVTSNRLLQSAELTRTSGRNARTASYLSAGSSLLTGAGKTYGYYKGYA